MVLVVAFTYGVQVGYAGDLVLGVPCFQTPIGGLAEVDGDRLYLRGEILAPDGRAAFQGHREGDIADGAAMGEDLARDLLGQAGPDIFTA